jgi:hypothetical protein
MGREVDRGGKAIHKAGKTTEQVTPTHPGGSVLPGSSEMFAPWHIWLPSVQAGEHSWVQRCRGCGRKEPDQCMLGGWCVCARGCGCVEKKGTDSTCSIVQSLTYLPSLMLFMSGLCLGEQL